MIETNIFGMIAMSQAALPVLDECGGSKINIISVAGQCSRPGESVYVATKPAVDSLTKSWVAELALSGVRVNAVASVPVDTPIFEKTRGTRDEMEARKKHLIPRLTLGRIGRPEETARWVPHVADPAASWVTALVIGIDGGVAS